MKKRIWRLARFVDMRKISAPLFVKVTAPLTEEDIGST
jgi:hypothetical protein